MIDSVRYPPSVQCTAHKADGTQCKKWATRGTRVCKNHGASAPRVKKAAERSVQEAVAALKFASPTAADRLIGLLDSEDETVVIRASDQILRRVIKEPVSLEVSGSVALTAKGAGEIVKSRLAALAARHSEIEEDRLADGLPEPPVPGEAMRELMAARTEATETVISAIIVDADPDPTEPASDPAAEARAKLAGYSASPE